MHRAVHRLEEEAVEGGVVELVDKGGAGAAFFGKAVEVVRLHDRCELGILVIGEVPGGAVEVELADMRGEDLGVALLVEFCGDEVLELLADGCPGGLPEDEPLADFLADFEKTEFPADLAVVTLFGLFKLFQVSGQFFLGKESGAIDALELLVFLVPAVVGPCDGEELEGFDLFGVVDVCPGAKVHELAVAVKRDGLPFGDVGKATDLVGFLAGFLNDFDRFFAADFHALEPLVFLDDVLHLGLDGFEVFGGEFVIQVDIVVKAGVRWGADVELGLREEPDYGGCKDVRAGVAEFFKGCHLFHGMAVGKGEWLREGVGGRNRLCGLGFANRLR